MRFKNFNTYINETLKKEMKLPEDVHLISRLYQKANKKLFVVGGAVRDFLHGKTPKDFDLATDATPDESLEIIKPHFRTMEIGKAFGVVIAITKDNEEYEIATFRRDEGKGRRPDSVTFTNIETDVLRRDLTINALFYDIQKGEIVDLVGGMKDLEDNKIRTVGNPAERFEEDSLRKLRAIRFMARMGANLDKDTEKALKDDPSLTGVSPERIRDEFMKILNSTKSMENAINTLEKFKFFQYIFPDLEVVTDDVAEKSPIVTIALLLRDNDFSVVNKTLNKLTYSRDEVSAVSFLIRLQSLDEKNAYEMKRIQERSPLSNDSGTVLKFAEYVMPSELAKAFASYKITTTGEQLEREGFVGAEIGKEMKAREEKKFIDHLRTI